MSNQKNICETFFVAAAVAVVIVVVSITLNIGYNLKIYMFF